MSWTCKECGEELSSDALFLDKYCSNCYTPVFDLAITEVVKDLGNRICELDEKLKRLESTVTPSHTEARAGFNIWEGLDVLQTIAIKWQFNIFGGFFSALMLLIAKADDFNRERLRRGFPDHVKAYELFINEPGWWDATLALAKKLKYIKENRT